MRPEQLKDAWMAEWETANKLFDEGKQDEAETRLANCCRLSPETWAGIGMECLKDDDYQSAMRRFREALHFAKNPRTRAICLNNIGTVLANYGRRAESWDWFHASISEFPSYPDPYANVGLCYKWNGETDKALQWIDKALELNPHHQQAAFTRAITLLLGGRMKEGWEAYESRWHMRGHGMRKIEVPWPEWDGTNGKKILIYGEQGVGDNLQMLRYAKAMQDRGLEVQALVRKPIKAVFEQSGALTKVSEITEPFSNFDAHISAFSLPRVMGTTLDNIPYPNGYIPKPPLSDVMEYGSGLNVGIFWSGAIEYKQNIFRSTHLHQWRNVLSVPGITWHSLQVGNGEEEAMLFPQVQRYPCPEDYLETARRIAGLDLVITVDTGLAHLVGAMGVPVWIMIPHGGDFRWLLEREDSPWYSSARLFRSKADFEWAPVFDRIRNALLEL